MMERTRIGRWAAAAIDKGTKKEWREERGGCTGDGGWSIRSNLSIATPKYTPTPSHLEAIAPVPVASFFHQLQRGRH